MKLPVHLGLFRFNLRLNLMGFALGNKVCEHLYDKMRSCKIIIMTPKLTSIVSRGPPALSGWNWTPQTFFPDSLVDLMPSTDESLQFMKNGSHPWGKGSCNVKAY
jgi:hypothetical protein